jgi:hypothetical protein
LIDLHELIMKNEVNIEKLSGKYRMKAPKPDLK